MKIYNIVSVAHLELAINPTLDLYSHVSPVSTLIIIDNYEKYKIKRLIRKR